MLFLRLDLKGGTGKLPLIGTVVLGRSNTADLVLDCKTVSRIHCRIRETADGQIYVEDLGSELGTRVNGRPAQGMVPLLTGHVLQVGSFAFTICDDSGKAAHAQPVGAQAPSDADTAPIPVVRPAAAGALAALSTADDIPPPAIDHAGKQQGLGARATDDDFIPPTGWQTGPASAPARPAAPPRPADAAGQTGPQRDAAGPAPSPRPAAAQAPPGGSKPDSKDS